jgi:hypothetical protein
MEVNRILERLNSLISMGEQVLRSPVSDRYYVDAGLVQKWRTSSLAFLEATFGSDSIHYRDFEERCKFSNRSEAERGLAILESAKESIEAGYLQKVETLVSASVFSDFLEMAEHLLDNGYKDPAASLIGAVLEDGLRRICGSSNLAVKSDDNISSLNKRLADNSAYNRLQQREIEVWNKLRDYADHGHFDEYKADDVADMLKGVRNFLSSYLK